MANNLYRYLKKWKWPHLKEMLKNEKIEPKECLEDFHGRCVVITGATSGIGYVASHEYASHGANLFVINRNEKKSQLLCYEIKNKYGVECNYQIADFTRISEIHKMVKELSNTIKKIDVFIHNAGVYSTKKIFTACNLELVFQVNYLSSFIINYMLKDQFIKWDTRIILVNSEGHRFALSGIHLDDLAWNKHFYSGLKSYGASKTAQILSMLKFKEYFKCSLVTINAMHPGNVKTNMGENNGSFYRFFKHKIINPSARDPKISAVALYYLGVSGEIAGITGKFFNLTTIEKPAPHALDLETAEKLWNLSIKLGGLNER